MFGLSNADSIVAVVFLDLFISWLFGMIIDLKEEDYAAEYREYVGCSCAAPMLFVVNLIGVGALVALNVFGILGPWWTWVVGIVLPYIVVAFVLIMSAREEAREKMRQKLSIPK